MKKPKPKTDPALLLLESLPEVRGCEKFLAKADGVGIAVIGYRNSCVMVGLRFYPKSILLCKYRPDLHRWLRQFIFLMEARLATVGLKFDDA